MAGRKGCYGERLRSDRVMTTSVIHIATSPTGGAGIAARRLHNALRFIGVGSRMTVARGGESEGDIVQFSRAAHKLSVMDRIVARRIKRERRMTSKTVSRKLAYFSDDRVPGPDRLAARPWTDVLNLHWVAGFLDYGKFFPTVREGQPLVWTLHDMAPMTGGCHYAMDCDRFTERCGACPLLGSTAEGDLTRRIHRRKAAALSRLRPETTRIVAPSRWLAGEAQRSSLLGQFEVEVIPNGLDVDIFQPRDRGVARDMLGLPRDGLVLLFVAESVNDYRKGFDLLQEALRGLGSEKNVTLAALGGSGSDGLEDALALGRVDNAHIMSHIYSAADMFVSPTRADNLPNVLVEAMACGVPCVSFNVGGVPDVVRHEETGLLAPAEDVHVLREAIERLLGDDGLRRRMGNKGREIAETEFSDRRVAARYKVLYEELIAASKGAK